MTVLDAATVDAVAEFVRRGGPGPAWVPAVLAAQVFTPVLNYGGSGPR